MIRSALAAAESQIWIGFAGDYVVSESYVRAYSTRLVLMLRMHSWLAVLTVALWGT